MDVVGGLATLVIEAVGPIMATLMALIAVDLILGVAVALRTGTFKWRQVAQFYQTNVLPYGLAAVAVEIVAQFVSLEVLGGDLAEIVAQWGGEIGTVPLFSQLILGSIVPNVLALVQGKQKWQITDPEWDFTAYEAVLAATSAAAAAESAAESEAVATVGANAGIDDSPSEDS